MNIPTITSSSNLLKNEFTNKLGIHIENDIHNTFYVNINVEVYTDFESVRIELTGDDSDDIMLEIYDYVYSKYCRSLDEVIIKDEKRNS